MALFAVFIQRLARTAMASTGNGTRLRSIINIKGDMVTLLKEKRLTGLFPGAVALPESPKGSLRTKSK
jgi:hypothetical protein